MKGVYWLVKQYASLNLSIFYRRFEVVGRENIPVGKPVIFVANHQNAFMDAILVACSTSKPIHFLVRAGIFHSKFVTWLLGLLNMMPIYRFRDGIAGVKKNDLIIDRCVRLLSKNGSLLIFPEGNHDMRRRLRPLQKGMARIAYQALEQNNFELDIQIVPVGINYESHTAFRTHVLVKFGEPVKALDFISDEKDKRTAWETLTDAVSDKMQSLIVHVDKSCDYNNVIAEWQCQRKPQPNLSDQLSHDQALVSELDGQTNIEINNQAARVNKWAWLNPVFIYGWLNHAIAYFLLHFILKKFVWDNTFYASLKFAVGMFLVPLAYVLQVFLFYKFIWHNPLISLGYFCTLPIAGLWAHYIYFKQRYPFHK